MFGKKTVIYITKNKIWAGNIFRPPINLLELEWDGIDPSSSFVQIKKDLHAGSVRIILGNDISYVFVLLITQKETTREQILEKARTLIPEDLSDHDFDWKITGNLPPDNINIVQVVATSPDVLNNISYAAKINKFNIESIDVASQVLAASLKSLATPQLILWSQDQEKLSIIAYKGNVFFAENLKEDKNEKIIDLIPFAKNNFQLEMKNIVKSWKGEDVPAVPPNLEISEVALNPFMLSAQKEISHGKDEDVLEIKPLENPRPIKSQGIPGENVSAQPNENTKSEVIPAEIGSKNNFPRKKIIIIFIISFLIGLIVIGSVLFIKIPSRAKPVSAPVTTPAFLPSPTATASATIKLSDFSVQILNGSGTAGEANRVRDILKAEGFVKFDTGNAGSYDYKNTEISLKDKIPDGVFQSIERALNGDFTIVKSKPLTEDSKYDVMVVIGKKK